MHFLYELARRFPQIALPVAPQTHDSDAYRAHVLKGEPLPEGFALEGFSLSGQDRLETVDSPIGPVEVMTFAQRGDFELAVQALAYGCRPTAIPASMGAINIRGLAD